MNRTRLIEGLKRLSPFLVTALAVACALRRFDNTDTWWHLAAGRWIVQHRAIPWTDTLSYTVRDHAWINVQWLFDVVIYALYQAGGPSLLILTAALAYGAAVALLIVNLRTVLGPVASASLAFWVTVVAQERFAIRPEMVSFLLLEILLWLYTTGVRPDRRRIWWVPSLILLWVNCHSLFIIGIVIVLAHFAWSVVSLLPLAKRLGLGQDSQVARRIRWSAVIALLATLANPFGFTGSMFPLILMSRINGSIPAFSEIGEFRRPFSGYFVTLPVTVYQLFLGFSLGAVLIALTCKALSQLRMPSLVHGRENRAARRRAARRRGGVKALRDRIEITSGSDHSGQTAPAFDGAGLLVFIGLAYLSLLARRNMAIFVLGVAPFLARCLQLVRFTLPARIRMLAGAIGAVGAGILPPVLLLAIWFVTSNYYYRWTGELHESGVGMIEHYFPTLATSFVRQMDLPSPMFNDASSGGYLAWERPGDQGVYIDGRLEVYGADFFSVYSDNLKAPKPWQADMDQRGIQTVFLFHRWSTHQSLIRWLLHDERWALVYYDDVAMVLVRRAGNESLIANARAAFDTQKTEIEGMLLDPAVPWRWPAARSSGLFNYARLLELMGNETDAVQFYSRFVDLHPSSSQEVRIRLFLSRYYIDNGDLTLARLHLERVAQLDPHNRSLPELENRIEE